MVDDKSTDDFLGEPLERYVRLLPKVTLVRNKNREGLIRSRMVGFHMATSPVVIFLDAHTEANEGKNKGSITSDLLFISWSNH